MIPRKTYEVTLQETRTYVIEIDAADTDEAAELAADLYLHTGFDAEPRFRLVDKGGYDVLEIRRIKRNESTTHG